MGFNAKMLFTLIHFPFKYFSWEEVNNIILRDNMLTIDFKNNKIIQRETDLQN